MRQDEIEHEKKRLERDVQAEQQPILAKIEEHEQEVAELESQNGEASAEIERLEDERRHFSELLEDVRQQRSRAEKDEQDHQNRLKTLQRARNNVLLPYGGDAMVHFCNAINQERGWRQKPIGPIGLSIKLNREAYSTVLESFFGATLNSFIVTNDEDRALLSRLHRQFKL